MCRLNFDPQYFLYWMSNRFLSFIWWLVIVKQQNMQRKGPKMTLNARGLLFEGAELYGHWLFLEIIRIKMTWEQVGFHNKKIYYSIHISYTETATSVELPNAQNPLLSLSFSDVWYPYGLSVYVSSAFRMKACKLRMICWLQWKIENFSLARCLTGPLTLLKLFKGEI